MDDNKILDMLTQLSNTVSQLAADMREVKQDIVEVKQDQHNLRYMVDKLAINQENIIMPRLDLLYEGQVALRAQLDTQLPGKVEDAQSDISTLQSVVRIHSKDIKEIKDDITTLKQA